MECYTDSLQYLLAELERIDILIQVQVWRARQTQVTEAEFQGLYISEQELERLLNQPVGLPRWASAPMPGSSTEVQVALERMEADINERKAQSAQRGIQLRLDELVRQFHLTPLDLDILLVCLAPELDLRYERLYAYLQDDITKKRPSVDLVFNLLCPSFEAKVAARQRLALTAPQLKYQLLTLFDDPSQHQPPLLSKFLKVDERIVNYLLDSDECDARLLPYVQSIQPQVHLDTLSLPDDLKRRLGLLVQQQQATDTELILYLQGPYGVGKQAIAEAICRELGLELVVVEVELLLQANSIPFERVIRLACREAILRGAVLYWQGFDALLAEERQSWLDSLLQVLEEQHRLTFLAGDSTWEPIDALYGHSFVRIELPYPKAAERLKLWQTSLNGHLPANTQAELKAVASKFRFSGGQIRDAASTARNLALWRDPKVPKVMIADLYEACRLQSNRKLSTLATKVNPHYRWDDIILPGDQLQLLREICNSVKYRALVYDEWGFDSKLALGKGLNMFFAGAPGTGKTMAADIMAGELGLDLYKIDLSTVVSKYIGETEKNLSRIFSEAATSNAILFFDEADALFGKRSEVRDSHDRYANIEISYLLQRMEEYQGVVILATNLRKNMDDAFVRRMHFSVEFPMPSRRDRRRIWEQIWPDATPRSPNLDLDFLARRFEIAGGNIRNIALASAFLAAADGGAIEMAHLLQATRREYQKMGKVVAEGEFAKYAASG